MTTSRALRRRIFELIILMTLSASHIRVVIGEGPCSLATMDASEVLIVATNFNAPRIHMAIETGWHFFAVRPDGRLALWQIRVFVVGMDVLVLMAALAQSAPRNRFVKAFKLIRATSSMTTTTLSSSMFPG